MFRYGIGLYAQDTYRTPRLSIPGSLGDDPEVQVPRGALLPSALRPVARQMREKYGPIDVPSAVRGELGVCVLLQPPLLPAR